MLRPLPQAGVGERPCAGAREWTRAVWPGLLQQYGGLGAPASVGGALVSGAWVEGVGLRGQPPRSGGHSYTANGHLPYIAQATNHK